MQYAQWTLLVQSFCVEPCDSLAASIDVSRVRVARLPTYLIVRVFCSICFWYLPYQKFTNYFDRGYAGKKIVYVPT